MCTNVTMTASVRGSAKGRAGWMEIDTANVSFDHPFHAPFEHALNIDFVRASGAASERVAVELDADSARSLARAILSALGEGEAAVAVG